jgi:hypothetical protein
VLCHKNLNVSIVLPFILFLCCLTPAQKDHSKCLAIVKIWQEIKQTRRKMFTNSWIWGETKTQRTPLVHLTAATFLNTHFQSKIYAKLTLPSWDQPQQSPQVEVWPPPDTAAI